MKLKIFTIDNDKERFSVFYDLILITLTLITLILRFVISLLKSTEILSIDLNVVLATLSFLGTLPVAISAVKALINRRITIDLLATIALVFSMIMHEWSSAAFINLMLAFARIFENLTDAHTRKTIKALMKYHVEWVRLRVGDSIKNVHINDIKIGDLVIIESGDNVPVDGVIVSGQAEINESSLTGESELISKKIGDKVFTSTINESGSLIVKVMKLGQDTTLARIIRLVDESSRNKNRAERIADKFSTWYIAIVFLASILMYLSGIDLKVILAILLVVCADDIAVAVPLTYTIAIDLAARLGVIVKGSAAFEQLSRMKYILTDKTGTLTKGKPKVDSIKSYGKYDEAQIIANFISGASESRHAVSRAIIEYAKIHKIDPHVPDTFTEIPGEGVSFTHDGHNMLMGRMSLLENNHIAFNEKIKDDITIEKDKGRGLVFLSIDNHIAGLLSYTDELRPRVSETIAKTKALGIKEWHMLTGDNEKVASAIAKELNIRHYHANLKPEGKVAFISRFEKEYGPDTSKDPGIVGYIGDGVNDAASLALADVSIAMGGIGSDAAIEASDITIMKDNLDKVPEIIEISKRLNRVMKANFWIWGITNAVGLYLVIVGIPGVWHLDPAGAATYNFITDFIPIFNAFRIGKK